MLPSERLALLVGALIVYWSILRITTKMSSNTEEIKALVKCYNFAAIKYAEQRRKGPDHIRSNVNHPIGITQVLSAAGKTDINILQAAILHSLIETTDTTTLNEIEKEFGVTVRTIVADVTDDKTLPISYEARLIKLAQIFYYVYGFQDRISNGRTEEEQIEFFQWAKKQTDDLRGTEVVLEKILDNIFKKENVL